MEEEQVLLQSLFDYYWFDHQILFKNPPPITPPLRPHPDPDLAAASASASDGHIRETRLSSLHRRSLSNELASASSSDSALLAHRPPKLYTIFSGKEPSEEEEKQEEEVAVAAAAARSITEREASITEGIGGNLHKNKNRHKERRSRSKSLPELEFEELKGFMDLGFTFPEEEADHRLMSIVPGLQRLGRRRASSEGVVEEEVEGVIDESSVPRPYLSEAWAVAEERSRRKKNFADDRLLRKWRIPAATDGVDMKDYLRSWAHIVASTVR